MIYYKNIFLKISNGLNSLRVSKAANANADSDAMVLGAALMSPAPVNASNNKEYYYFSSYSFNSSDIQYLLNSNGVLAYRRYSGYQIFYGQLREIVRVPVEYVNAHPKAKDFMDKVLQANARKMLLAIDFSQASQQIKERRRKRQK